MNKPNFFIVGAPKCGTTALSHYLSQHPDIFFCNPKEPHYFADDLDGHRFVKNLTSYLNLFEGVSPNQRLVGEGSVLYLYSKQAIKNIYNFDPNSKIIVMLRNPVELVPSLHQQYLHALYEDEVDFKTAWNLQDSRKIGLSIPRLCRQPELLMYSEVGKLGEQVERLLSIFPKEQIKFILFDDFVEDASKVHKDVLNFLSISDDNRNVFERVNESQALRSGLLRFFVSKTPITIRNQITKMRFNPYLRWLPLFADKVLKKKVKRDSLDANSKALLRDFFKDDMVKLGALIGKDLAIWKD